MFKQKFKNAMTACRSACDDFGNACANMLRSPRFGVFCMMLIVATVSFAQNAAGDYSAGTNALSSVTVEIAKYVPIVVKLCYAIAGVVAVVGAISVYIKMNNEENDVKNILVLQNWLERIRKEVTNKVLSIKRVSDFFEFSDSCSTDS